MLKAFRQDGTEVRPGDIITDFRSETATFERATRAPHGHRTGRIQVDGPHGSEFYMTVFNLDVREVPDANPA
jgi:hypothetical protein